MSVVGPSSGWDADEALRNLKLENALDANETPTEMAKRLLSENVPLAVLAICHMAKHSQIEAIRFNAAKYVVDRTFGPYERGAGGSDDKHVWDDIYDNVITEAEAYLKKE